MKKDFIKNKLRESLFDKIREAGKNSEEKNEKSHPKKDKDEKPESKKEERSTKKDYDDVKNYFKKNLHFSQVSIMKQLPPEKKPDGTIKTWEDDEEGANRSLFGKMLHQDVNPEGGLYQFDDDQLDIVRSAIKNKQ